MKMENMARQDNLKTDVFFRFIRFTPLSVLFIFSLGVWYNVASTGGNGAQRNSRPSVWHGSDFFIPLCARYLSNCQGSVLYAFHI